MSAGAGGQEAMIFTGEMFYMYEKFARYIGWDFDVISLDENEAGMEIREIHMQVQCFRRRSSM